MATLSVCAEIIIGRVDTIADGNTVTIEGAANQRHRIRLSGIAAPDKAQPFGDRSTSNLSAMTFGRTVTAECGKRDRYGWEVCKILLDGQDVNLEQLKAGMAWWDKHYAHEQSAEDRSTYERAQFWAQAGRLGLWSETNPESPWKFRHEKSPDP